MANLRPAAAPLAVAASALLGGCYGPLNNEPGIGNAGRTFGDSVWTPPTLAEPSLRAPAEGFEPTTDQTRAPVYAASGPSAPGAAKPSLLTLDRSNWADVPVPVPNDLTAHQPLLRSDYLVRDGDPRPKGNFPNENTALQTATTRHNDEQVVESLVAPFKAAFNVIMLPIRAAVEMRPQQPTRTGPDPYLRARANVTIPITAIRPAGDVARIGGIATTVPPTAPPPALQPLVPIPQPPAPAQPAPGAAPAPLPAAPPAPEAPAAKPAQPPAEELRPGGAMPASDRPGPK